MVTQLKMKSGKMHQCTLVGGGIRNIRSRQWYDSLVTSIYEFPRVSKSKSLMAPGVSYISSASTNVVSRR